MTSMKKLDIESKKNFIILILPLLFSFSIIPVMSQVSAKDYVKTKAIIDIKDDLTFDVVISHTWDSGEITEYSEDSWWALLGNLGKELNSISARDDFGDLSIEKVDMDRLELVTSTYKLNLQFRSKPIGQTYTYYISSKGNKLLKLNEGVFYFEPYLDSVYHSTTDEDYDLIVNYPKNLSLLSFDKKDLVNSKEEDGKLTLRYFNSGSSHPIGFFDKRYIDFTKMEVGGGIFIIENTPLYVEVIKEVKKHIDLIDNFPKDGSDIVFITANISKVFNGTEGAFYSIEKDLIVLNSQEPNVSIKSLSDILVQSTTLLHELTHLSVEKNCKDFVSKFPIWVNEGLAVYTETKYMDLVYSNYTGPYSESDLGIKPQESTQESNLTWWYERHDPDFGIADARERYSYYPLYGFIISNYAQTYGTSALQNAIKDSCKKALQEEEKKSGENFLNHTEAESIFVSSLISSSNQPITAEDIFFPERSLFLKNREDFFKVMYEFTAHTAPQTDITSPPDITILEVAEKQPESKTLPASSNKTKGGLSGILIVVVLIAAAIAGGAYYFFKIRKK